LITEEDVECSTYEAKYSLCPSQYDIKQWKNSFSFHVDSSSLELIVPSMAYVESPQDIEPIFQAKKKQRERSTSKPTTEEPMDTSLADIFEPLKQLKSKIQREKLQNLFTAVLNFSDDEIDVSFFKKRNTFL
jgi:hypothetical protein